MSKAPFSADTGFHNSSQEKTERLNVLSDGNTRLAETISPGSRIESGHWGRVPASGAQESLWFVDQFEGAGAAYNMPLEFRLHGRLNQQVLERALNSIVQRHEVLRTTLVSEDGKCWQQIAREGRFALRFHDMR